jgi:hypothetical protein
MRREFVWSGIVGLASVVAAAVYGCGENSSGDCSDNGTCPSTDASGPDAGSGTPEAAAMADGGVDATVDAGSDGSAVDSSVAADGGSDAGDATPPAVDASDASQCDPSGDPMVNPCAVDVAYGVFVSTNTGMNDAGTAGTPSAPWKTITEGIAAAAVAGKGRVYICGGTYSEQVVIDAAHDGVSLYGSFDCSGATWKWSTATPVQVNGPTPLYALRINGTQQGIVVADVAFTTPDATGTDANGNGNSSIAGFVSQTAGVTLLRASFTAGAGANGAAGGAPVSNWFSQNTADLLGNPAATDGGVGGGAAKTCPCASWGDSTGGAGGTGGDGTTNAQGGDGGAGTADPAAAPVGSHNGSGGAGYNFNSGRCESGLPGADGNPRTDGGAASATTGSVTSNGWTPAGGTAGVAGNPGQGGGGGGGGQGTGGGGGGCGGCGGAGGTLGGGGGGSIALLGYSSELTILQGSFTTVRAGNGGPGGSGEIGGGGGGGNVGACGGNSGGGGAGGQGGSGGSGGVSVGVLSDSTTNASIDRTTQYNSPQLPVATGGAGGPGGDGGTSTNAGSAGSLGIAGVVQQTLVISQQ